MRVVVRSRLLTNDRASTIGMYVPKSPTAPESSDQREVLSLRVDGRRKKLRRRRGVVVVEVSGGGWSLEMSCAMVVGGLISRCGCLIFLWCY